MELSETTNDVGSDFKLQTLEWAASMVEGKPSQRLEFLKEYIGMLSSGELRRLKKMVQNTKRRVVKEEENAKKSKLDELSPSPVPPTPEAATSSTDAVNSSGGGGSVPTPWWTRYKDENIIAWDSEYVSYPIPGAPGEKIRHQNYTATLDVVNSNLKCVLSRRVYHKKGSFLVNEHTQLINEYSDNTFDDERLPKFEDVKKEVDNFFRNKLVITCGGIHDFTAIGLNMGDYDVFDLQTHWFRTKYNERGAEIREPHSLRSLVNAYFKEAIQDGTHTSIEVAVNTMKLFEKYKEIKVKHDPDNVDKRINETRSYDEIKVIPSAVKKKLNKKKKQQAHPRMQLTLR